MLYPVTPEVETISRLHLEGNIIPHTWYQNITLSGHPDVIAITILADIVYWYRWRELRDEATGAVVGYGQSENRNGKARTCKTASRWKSLLAVTMAYSLAVNGLSPVMDAMRRRSNASTLAKSTKNALFALKFFL